MVILDCSDGVRAFTLCFCFVICLTLFECEKIWRVCGGDILSPHFPALPDILFSRKIPQISHLSWEIHSKPTINNTKAGVKYRFGHRIGDAIGGVGFCHFGHKPISASGKSERSRWYTSVPCRRGYHLKPPLQGCRFVTHPYDSTI